MVSGYVDARNGNGIVVVTPGVGAVALLAGPAANGVVVGAGKVGDAPTVEPGQVSAQTNESQGPGWHSLRHRFLHFMAGLLHVWRLPQI